MNEVRSTYLYRDNTCKPMNHPDIIKIIDEYKYHYNKTFELIVDECRSLDQSYITYEDIPSDVIQSQDKLYQYLRSLNKKNPLDIDQYLDRVNYRELLRLIYEGYHLKSSSTGDKFQEELNIGCDHTIDYLILIPFIEPSDRVYIAHPEVDPDLIKAMEEYGLHFKLDNKCHRGEYMHTHMRIIYNRRYLTEPLYIPEHLRLLILLCDFYSIPYKVVHSVKRLMEFNINDQVIKVRKCYRLRYIIKELGGIDNIKNGDDVMNYINERIKRDKNTIRLQPIDIMGTIKEYGAELIAYQLAVRKSGEFNKGHIPFILSRLSTCDMQALELLLWLNSKSLINLADYRNKSDINRLFLLRGR